MQEVGSSDSRQQTEERLIFLRDSERALLDAIESNNGTMKDKIINLAQCMEERINLLDPMLSFVISDISTNITRVLRSLNLPIANKVREYLPDKYKNEQLAKWGKLASIAEKLLEGDLDGRLPIEQSSVGELETFLEAKQKAKNDLDKAITQLNNDIEDVRREAVRRGLKEIAGEKIRDSIPARDYRFEISNDADLQELNEEVILQLRRVIHEYEVFIQNFIEYPAYTKEDARKWGNSARTYANMMAIVNEKKWSGETDFWLDRNYWKKAQSSHKSGNSTMFPTTLCARCSKDIDENPKDFHVTKYDKTSPTGYRCDNCQGTEIMERFNSREQVGDKGPEVDRMASDIINHIEHYVDIFKDWRTRSLNPAIYARKRAISNKFRESSMGKEAIVIPRKKSK